MRIIIVGAGVFGAWTAKALCDAGHRVTLIDAYGPANGRASSADHSRVIRAGYGRDEIYSHWAAASLRDWQWLCDAAGQMLLARTGALFMGEPGNTYVADTAATLSRLGLPVETLAPSQVRARFPQIDPTGLGDTVVEHEAGVIRARAAVQALVGLLVRSQRCGYLPAHVVVDEAAATCRPSTPDGHPLDADAYVFACGPWLSRIFPVTVGARLRATRQEVLYFGVPPGDARFSAARLPVWIDFAAGLYGVGDLDAVGFKVGIDRHGPPIDPDTADRHVDEAIVRTTRGWLARRFPALGTAPLVDARVCQYENSSSGDFILDRHPVWPNCWLAGGGSGHGFKHGPAVGRHLASLVAGTTAVHERFSLAAKTATPARTVY